MAYGEPFETATPALRFDGAGVRLDGVTIAKAGGSVEARRSSAGTRRIRSTPTAGAFRWSKTPPSPIPRAQPTGLIEFTAGGSGTFDAPRYDVRFRINDLFVAEEGVGQVTGTLALRGEELSGEVDVASPRLAVTGTGGSR